MSTLFNVNKKLLIIQKNGITLLGNLFVSSSERWSFRSRDLSVYYTGNACYPCRGSSIWWVRDHRERARFFAQKIYIYVVFTWKKHTALFNCFNHFIAWDFFCIKTVYLQYEYCLLKAHCTIYIFIDSLNFCMKQRRNEILALEHFVDLILFVFWFLVHHVTFFGFWFFVLLYHLYNINYLLTSVYILHFRLAPPPAFIIFSYFSPFCGDFSAGAAPHTN